MKSEHKAILAAAEKDGMLPMEKDAALIVHDMVQATRKQMARYEVGYNKMTEKQQDTVLAELAEAFKETALIVARMIASAGTPSISMTCKDMKISNGTLTGIVSSAEQHFNDLISKVQDKSEVLIVLYEREYSDALDNIQSDKDQRTLPLGDDAPKTKAPLSTKAKAKEEDKPIEIPEGMLNQAREFVTGQQNATFGGLQNFLMIDIRKADAIFKLLEGEGLVRYEGDEKTGNYVLVRASDTPAQEASGEASGEAPRNFNELCALVKAKVIESGQVSVGALTVALDASVEDIEQAIDALEMDGVVSEEDDLGGRTVLAQAE